MPLAIHVHIVSGNVCTNLERFLSYGPRLKFLHDDEDDDKDEDDDDDAKAMTIARLFFFEKQTS